ncbi:FkbM family methyltransferase [Novosphingobium humi]|nr:FkbM family methyltransferase [Novosphingobium humi]WJS99102.1 FkbM family methyltransferase [Novosphingobium humi]
MRLNHIVRFMRSLPLYGSGRRLDFFSISSLSRADRISNEAIIRGLCKVAYLGDNTVLCRALGHFKMFVDTRDVGLASHLMLDGYWEMWVTEAIAELVRPGMVVADIGANVGYFTLLMGKLVGAKGRVHAFEPNPRLVSLLHKSLSANGFSTWVDVHQVALSAENDREMALIIPPDEPKNAHMVPLSDHLPEGAVRIPSTRLDSRTDWQDIEFAKIDVEGAEEQVWDGLQGLLNSGRLRTVILEFAAVRYRDPEGFLKTIVESGFSLAYIDMRNGITATSIAQILAGNAYEDIMLVLRR